MTSIHKTEVVEEQQKAASLHSLERRTVGHAKEHDVIQEELASSDHQAQDAEEEKLVFGRFKPRTVRRTTQAIMWLLFTAFFVAAVVLNVGSPISVLSVAYAGFTLYLVADNTPEGFFAKPTNAVWVASASAVERIPSRMRLVVGHAIVPIAIILTAVIPDDSAAGTRVQRITSCCGLLVFLLLLFITSRNRKAIHWRTVSVGIGLQFILGVFVIKTYIGQTIFSYTGSFMATFLGFSSAGVAFILGDKFVADYGSFATGVLPAIVFFGAVIQVMYYYNIIQTAVSSMGKVVVYIFEISGIEVTSALAAPFVGMSESAMLIGPYLEHATNAEIHQVMASGFATISGSVFLGLASFGASPTHLITCCIMSVPCAIVTSKMRFPEEEVPLTRGKAIKLERESEDSFVLALANGSILGMQLCIVIAAVLIGFLSLLACANYIVNWVFLFLTVTDMTIQGIVAYFIYPFAWLVGIPSSEVYDASVFIGMKYILNEFAAFASAQDFMKVCNERTALLMTFIMCSFANPSSLGSQISLLGKMAPTRANDIANVAVSAIFAGALSTIMSACIAGIVS